MSIYGQLKYTHLLWKMLKLRSTSRTRKLLESQLAARRFGLKKIM